MITSIFIGLAAVIAIILVVAALRPADFRVTRQASFQAPASAVFVHLNDLHRWNAWSPWARMDPSAKNTFDGPPAGPGARMAWAGNSQVGEGRMTIVESKPDQSVTMKLEFLKPFAATNSADFQLTPAGDRTTLTWSMTGHNSYLFKLFGLFMNCDKMIGGQFEQGLANLREVVEASPQPAATALN